MNKEKEEKEKCKEGKRAKEKIPLQNEEKLHK
jgi:hypothetical protein